MSTTCLSALPLPWAIQVPAQARTIHSERSLYRLDYVTFEEDGVYNQRDAEGFIKLNALRMRLAKMARG